ncbi:MAG: family 43 glycosylhydrolase [Prevotella sp.]|nr:family 43 glycosylhydrolase [Prevotella sp.]
MKKRILTCGLAVLLSMPAVLAQETYTNPVKGKNLPDPTVIKGQDGWFYVYATENGEQSVPIYKSRDLVNWRLAGGAFTSATRPSFVPKAGIWAPDINYVNGQYVLYYSMSTWGGEWECGIGVATAPAPTGPFTDHGKLFISSEIGVKNSIDPCFFQDEDGKNYLFWGSFRGIYGIELSADGLAYKEGTRFQIAPGVDGNVDNTEGTMIVKRGDYYYLMGSSGTCCEGAASTYHVVVARSKSLKGPYVNKAGYSIMNHPFETILRKSEYVLGPGHNSELIVDDKGQYWMLYHGFEASDPDAGRQLYLDKVSWDKDGWPYIEDGKPSFEAEKPYFSTTGIDDAVADKAPYTVTSGGDNYYQISGPSHSPFTWRLYNARGEMVRNGQSVESKDLWVNDLADGIYIIQVMGQAGMANQKIVKMS